MPGYSKAHANEMVAYISAGVLLRVLLQCFQEFPLFFLPFGPLMVDQSDWPSFTTRKSWRPRSTSVRRLRVEKIVRKADTIRSWPSASTAVRKPLCAARDVASSIIAASNTCLTNRCAMFAISCSIVAENARYRTGKGTESNAKRPSLTPAQKISSHLKLNE